MVATIGIASIVAALAAWAYASTPAMTTTIPPQAVVSSWHSYLQGFRRGSQFFHRRGFGAITLMHH